MVVHALAAPRCERRCGLGRHGRKESAKLSPVTQLPWPERYEVALTSATGTGPDVSYAVLTWLHGEKAIAMAVAEHLRQYPESRIYDVVVKSLGLAERDEAGLVSLKGELHDRYEF